ncbi:MAG TPA: hypothetical protein VFC19_02560 [Candidatus Limnocylindrales bacterium]|nr:hypothetical protein [Candidatus Limnocylindrales bacterium]
MKYHNAFLTVAALAAATLLAGCTDNDKPTNNAPGAPKATSPSPSPPAKPPTYTMPDNVCTAVNTDAFADLVPAAPPKTSEKSRTQTGRTTSSTCLVTLGTLDRALLVSVGVDLFLDSFGAQGQYEGFRGLAFKDHRDARDVTGVGTAAYFFTDPDTGPHLVTRSGNAHISVFVAPIDSANSLPSDVETRLITATKTTLAKLPTT